MTPYGPVLGRKDVQAAVVGTLQDWTITYLAEVERQEGLAPRTIPAPGNVNYPPTNLASFRGGLDFDRYQADEMPLLIVLAQSTGEAERHVQGIYEQWFEVQVGVIVEDADQETFAEQVADWYGKAITLLLSQQGAFGTRVDPVEGTVPFAIKTVLSQAAKTEFVDPTDRKLARSVTVAHTLIPVADESQGPRVPPTDPYAVPLALPTVTTVDLQLLSEDPLGRFSPASGASITDPAGHVVITE